MVEINPTVDNAHDNVSAACAVVDLPCFRRTDALHSRLNERPQRVVGYCDVGQCIIVWITATTCKSACKETAGQWCEDREDDANFALVASMAVTYEGITGEGNIDGFCR
eukprot:353408-Chlamydomonas_euryale.AAC.10